MTLDKSQALAKVSYTYHHYLLASICHSSVMINCKLRAPLALNQGSQHEEPLI